MINEELKIWIDLATGDQIIERWKQEPMDAPIMQGDTGDYFRDVVRIELGRAAKNKSPSVATSTRS